MYLGLDFLVDGAGRPRLVDVNIGLPGGAEECDRTHRVWLGTPSGVFDRIEALSLRAYGKTFRDYIASLPFLEGLKQLKLWLDGRGPFPETVHPALRLEDKWVQYRVVGGVAPMPETALLDPRRPEEARRLLAAHGRAVLKRRLGRGGRDLRVIENPGELAGAEPGRYGALLQEHVDSRADGYVFSLRAVAFAGECVGMYANLAPRPPSNHGLLVYVAEGDGPRLSTGALETVRFDQRSWEAGVWFGPDEPEYLRHNLYEDEVARAALLLPGPLLREVRETAVRVERLYEGLDFAALPRAWFDEGDRAT
ncbi:MAG TPA: hypothetical protein VMS75_02045 [Terriglobales bacterium]|nr:hypothetical protein [Terriglobales bacterium]